MKDSEFIDDLFSDGQVPKIEIYEPALKANDILSKPIFLNYSVLTDRQKDIECSILKSLLKKLVFKNKVSEEDVKKLNFYHKAVIMTLFNINQEYLFEENYVISKQILRKYNLIFSQFLKKNF